MSEPSATASWEKNLDHKKTNQNRLVMYLDLTEYPDIHEWLMRRSKELKVTKSRMLRAILVEQMKTDTASGA